MPTFNFSLAPTKKKERQTTKSDGRFEVVERNLIGVVFITLTADYEVQVAGNRYDIKEECYTCKDYARIYTHSHNLKEWICYIRNQDDLGNRNILHWLPFIEGCSVKGNIIRDKVLNKKVFLIKEIYEDYSNPVAHAARQFYRENAKEIFNAIIDKRINAT